MFQNLVNLFFPKVCLGCQALLLKNETIICTTCRFEMPFSNFHLNAKNDAYQKFYGKVAVEFVSTLLFFQKKGFVQELFHNLKYRGHQEIGTMFGNWYAEELKKVSVLQSIDFIIPVPIHQKRLKKRGYNQVTTFGLALSEQLQIPYNSAILTREKHTKTQVFKTLLDRMEIDETIFGVQFDEIHKHKHFLLIDDILTTGATLEACTRKLQKIPGAKVSIVCMALTQ